MKAKGSSYVKESSQEGKFLHIFYNILHLICADERMYTRISSESIYLYLLQNTNSFIMRVSITEIRVFITSQIKTLLSFLDCYLDSNKGKKTMTHIFSTFTIPGFKPAFS